MERLGDPALHVVLADPLDQPVFGGPSGKRVNCALDVLAEMSLPPEFASRPTEGVEDFDCVGIWHVNSSKCLRQNHCGFLGQPVAVKARSEPHTEQGWSPG
jgi:hypothetical protein